MTGNSSPRSMPAGQLAELAGRSFGPDRVHAADRLDDAIEIAVGLADEGATDSEGGLGSPGVLITGSVVTAGDARVLLAAGPGSRGAAPVRRLCAIVLIMEAIVIGLAIPVGDRRSTRPGARPRWPAACCGGRGAARRARRPGTAPAGAGGR